MRAGFSLAAGALENPVEALQEIGLFLCAVAAKRDGHLGARQGQQAGIIERDDMDSSRADGPLICPIDATRIDTSELTFDEVVDVLERESRARITSLADNTGA